LPLTPPPPEENEQLKPTRASDEVLELLALRRSTLAREMTDPGPSPQELDDLLRIGARVPDHGKLGPWRYIVFEGDARERFGQILANHFQADEPNADEDRVNFERDRLTRAPLVVCVVSKVTPHPKAPDWEQVLCAGAVCQTLLVAANAMGYGAQWITEWYAYQSALQATSMLALRSLTPHNGCALLTKNARPDSKTRAQHWGQAPNVHQRPR
jgi:nitroreductase